MKLARVTFRYLAIIIGGCLVVVATGCSSSTPGSSSEPSTTGSNASTPESPNVGTHPGFIDANGVDLEGDWVSTTRQARMLTGLVEGSETITITEQTGAVFMVARDLDLNVEAQLGDTGLPTKTATDHPFLGIVNADGTITMVKKGDTGQLNGRLTDLNTMELSYTEAGDEPAVARVTLVRNGAVSTTSTTP